MMTKTKQKKQKKVIVSFSILTSKEYFMGLVKSFILDVLYKKEEKQRTILIITEHRKSVN